MKLKFLPLISPETYSADFGVRGSVTNLESEVMDEFQNPIGRTGIRGRGRLQNWGENKQLILLIWRWLKDGDGVNMTKGIVELTTN
jgi:hypothetical protein